MVFLPALSSQHDGLVFFPVRSSQRHGLPSSSWRRHLILVSGNRRAETLEQKTGKKKIKKKQNKKKTKMHCPFQGRGAPVGGWSYLLPGCGHLSVMVLSSSWRGHLILVSANRRAEETLEIKKKNKKTSGQ